MSKLVAISLLAVSSLLVAQETSTTKARPNVLFIISDDLGAQALGCYGNEECQTPHIDRLARQGVRFTRAYAQYPVCGPSRAALMSGLYAQSIGVTSNGHSSRLTANLGERPTLAQHFRQSGWFTARISKIYHMRVPGDITAGVDGPDHAASWSERFNLRGLEWMTPGEHVHLSNEKLRRDMKKHYGLGFGTAFYVVRDAGPGHEQPDYRAASKAIELLETQRAEPFFLAVGLVRPHVPLVAPERSFAHYRSRELRLAKRVDGDQDDIPRAGISKSSRSTGLEGADEKQRQVLEAYYASVTFMDEQVGRMLSALDRLGLREKTVVVFTSDHGYHLGEHGLWQKMSLHEESVRIPLIIDAPGKQPTTAGGLVEQIDIYPTLAALAGLPIPEHVQGHNLTPLLDGAKARVRDAAYCLRRRDHLLRTERWAYLSYADGSAELYDMENDPAQFWNLAEKPEHADRRREMERLLQIKLESLPLSAKP